MLHFRILRSFSIGTASLGRIVLYSFVPLSCMPGYFWRADTRSEYVRFGSRYGCRCQYRCFVAFGLSFTWTFSTS